MAVLAGCGILSCFLLVMNRRVLRPKEEVAKMEAEIALPAERPKHEQRRVAEAPPPRPSRAARAPRPNLATDMSALGAGVALFDAPAALEDLTAAMLAGGSDADQMVMTEETVDTQPQPLPSNRQPVPPPDAQRKRVSGHVVLRMLIDEQGSVQDVRIIESDPPGFFDASVLEAARSWRFSPATYRGKPVTLRVDQTIRFNLG